MTALARIGSLFPRNRSVDTVATRVHYGVSPETVWKGMMFYEEVPGRPSLLLRMFLPAPIRTQGEKTRVGSIIQCNYEGGYLEKRITESEPAQHVRFDVTLQQLGVEDCISMDGGSYEMRADASGTEVVLNTHYRGHLRPRWLFRPFEALLAHRLHKYILDGMRKVLEAPAKPSPSAAAPAPAE